MIAISDAKNFMFHSGITQEQKHHRALLFASMVSAGFVNFPPEWWHYYFGDKDWAVRTKQQFAIYTPQ